MNTRADTHRATGGVVPLTELPSIPPEEKLNQKRKRHG